MIPVHQENTRGRDFVIGDLHGCPDVLYRRMDEKRFDPTVDRIFATGDLVDRGPNSEGALALLDEPWFFSVMGNHEDAGILFATGKLSDTGWYAGIGGAWMIGKMPHERMDYALIMTFMPIAMEVEIGGGRRVGIVHADCPFDDWQKFRDSQLPDPNQTILRADAIRGTAMWARGRHERSDISPVTGIHAVIVGHTPGA